METASTGNMLVQGNMRKLDIFISLCILLIPSQVFAQDAYVTNGLSFLQAKQQSTGRITTGFSAPSQWSAIAFTIHGTDIKTVKNPDTSLHDFLLTDTPTNDNATEWETRILAIVATGNNPYSFNGVNYVAHLESFATSSQIGDVCSLNDDIFGLLALTASGASASASIKQDTLNFLITHQDSSDGGFGFSAPGCDWYSTSADMTGAGLHALLSAKNAGMTHTELDNAITKATEYLKANQNSDGGFGYYGSSDTDTTGWALIGLNAAGMQSSTYGTKAAAYLLSQQSPTDGGFMAFDWGLGASVSNATTTAQALIALSGKTWILTIYTPSAVITPSPTILPTTPTPTITPTPTPKAGLTSVSQDGVIYQTITITTTPSPKKKKTAALVSSAPQTVLGETISETAPAEKKPQSNVVTVLSATTKNPGYLLLAFGSGLLTLYFVIKTIQKKSWSNKNRFSN